MVTKFAEVALAPQVDVHVNHYFLSNPDFQNLYIQLKFNFNSIYIFHGQEEV